MNRGFTLLEIIVAAFVISLVAGGVFSLVVFNLRAVGDVGQHLEASYLAQEGIELVRNLRDANYLAIRKGQCDPIKNPNAWKGVRVDVPSCSGSPAPVIDLTGCVAGCEADHDAASLTPVGGSLNFLSKDVNGMYIYGVGTATPFKRKIIIDHSETDKLKVNVEVSWEGRSVVASTELYNWLTLPPPARSNGNPSGTLPAGTTATTLSLQTDQGAVCRYSTTAGIRYTAMTNNFTPDVPRTSHSVGVSGLGPGIHTYHVRCQGDFYNTSVNDFKIEFTIASS
ncbi:MAG: type II secretion system protein [Patescibacteria group bacterium]